jgi:uracil-DNA glycosylase
VRAHEANSHKGKGWETFTDAVLLKVNERVDPVVFLLWGGQAKKKKKLIHSRHAVVEGAHPSPLSAHMGFFGSKPFSAINSALKKSGKGEILWNIPSL